MRTLFALLALCAFTGEARGDPMEIWSYAFVTANEEQPIGGEGSSIFKQSGTSLEGPMWSVDHRFAYRLRFGLKGATIVALLWPEKDPDHQIEFRGEALQTPDPDGKGCLIRIALTNGSHHVLLQRSVAECAT